MTGTLHRLHRSQPGYLSAGVVAAALVAALLSFFAATASFAEEPIPDGPAPAPWGPIGDKRKNTTTVERGKTKGGGVQFGALLTGDGQQIEQGLIWRVYRGGPRTGKSKLVLESREASPIVKLPPGEYTVNAAFGRANLTRKITVRADVASREPFVLNAGGLRISALIGGKPAPPGAVSYSIFSDDHDEAEGNAAIISNAKPGLIVRLNSGIYRVVSLYGDANAKIEADVTVEAGKLTETTLTHLGGKATFKLVTRTGGEATPDTRWTVQTDDGDPVKESVGALPTHVFAPGDYLVTASSGGHLFQDKFQIKDGDNISVEVLMTNATDDGSSRVSSGATTIAPTSGGGTPMDFRSQ
jgi:hypothetical protein